MQNPRQRLIEAATCPLADNAEMKHAAAGFLENRITEDGDLADTMVARWKQVDARNGKSLWRIGLWVAVVAVSAGVLISDFDEICRLVPWGKWVAAGSIFVPLPESSVDHLARKLNDTDKLLLFGDLTKAGREERKEALWRSEPENPAYFADYAVAYMREKDTLPPNYLETARRIDPTNSWFTYLAAAEAKDAVKSKLRKSKRVAGKTVYEEPQAWEILDQARFDRALLLLKEAHNQPKCTDYSAELLRKRIPLLPEGSFVEKMDSCSCLSTTSGFQSIRLMVLAKAIAAKSWSLGESGNIPEFQEISTAGDQFLRRIYSEQNGTLVDELVKSAVASQIAESFGPTAEKLGLKDAADHWNAIATHLRDRNERRKSRAFIVDGKAVESGTITGGFMEGAIELMARYPDQQPPLSDADLKPQRLLDHEILSRVYSYLLWVMMALCLGFVAAYRFRVSALSRRLARRMENLLGVSDWMWILGAGVLLPFAFVMAINRLTPLGGRGFGVGNTDYLMPASHFFGLWLMWLVVPAQIIHWRLARRAAALGFRRPSWPGWVAVVVAAAFIPMIGWASISPMKGSWLDVLKFDPADSRQMPWMFWAADGLAVMSLLWVVWRISIALFCRTHRQLEQAASSFALSRAYAVILLVFALATVGFKASERYWFKQDTLSKFDPTTPGWSAYESRVAIQMRKELREILGYDH